MQTLLEGVVADAGQSIATLPLMTGTERQQLLVEWNTDQVEDDGKDEDGKYMFSHQLFELQVRGTPDTVAVNGCVIEGRLQLDWIFSENLHRRATFERAAQGFLEALRALLADSRSPETGSYTPSDFPEADLSQKKDLHEVIAELGEREE